MSRESLFNKIGVPLRAASGALAVGETAFFDHWGKTLEQFVAALVHLHVTTITTPDGDDEIDFFVQTAWGDTGFADSTANLLDDPLSGDLPPNASDVVATSDGTVFEVGDIIRIDNERMLVTAIATNDLTVRRGQEGDAVAEHAVNTDIYRLQVVWEDVANVHYATADNGTTAEAIITVGPAPAGVTNFAHSDQALADNTNRDLPLGDRLRIVVVLTGATAPTYAYSADVSLYGGA